MDRLIDFYERIFDARVTFDRVEEEPPRRRHGNGKWSTLRGPYAPSRASSDRSTGLSAQG
jgi:hypothetical protein